MKLGFVGFFYSPEEKKDAPLAGWGDQMFQTSCFCLDLNGCLSESDSVGRRCSGYSSPLSQSETFSLQVGKHVFSNT